MWLTRPNLGQEIYSPLPITILGVTIWSASPIRILQSRFTTRVPDEPASQLGASFASGWSKLPDELKIHILSFNLVSQDPLGESHGRHTIFKPETTFFRWHLRSTPEIARLSRDVYYSRNIIHLRPISRH